MSHSYPCTLSVRSRPTQTTAYRIFERPRKVKRKLSRIERKHGSCQRPGLRDDGGTRLNDCASMTRLPNNTMIVNYQNRRGMTDRNSSSTTLQIAIGPVQFSLSGRCAKPMLKLNLTFIYPLTLCSHPCTHSS